MPFNRNDPPPCFLNVNNKIPGGPVARFVKYAVDRCEDSLAVTAGEVDSLDECFGHDVETSVHGVAKAGSCRTPAETYVE